jgi:HD superfamily phosphohydrolase
MKTIRDAVHGDMRFDDSEIALVDARVVQRLRGIKQLGTSSLVYPSATHTRFEHSLGTCWVTKRLIDELARSGFALGAAEVQVARLAALLHDVTHVPFGHTFEDERRLLDRHDEDRARLDFFLDHPSLGPVLERSGVGREVRALLRGEPGLPPYVRQLVTGTVCADLLDYLKRDAYHCGLVLGYDDRIFNYFAIADDQLVFRLHKRGVFRRDALSELVHLLQIRYSLTERVYYHHAKIVAGAMVSRALELAMLSGLWRRETLYELRDDSFLDRLVNESHRVPGVSGIMDDLFSRRLYRKVYVLGVAAYGRPGLTSLEQDALAARYHLDLAARRAAERHVAEALQVPQAHVIVYCPSPSMALKEADVNVEIAPAEVRPLSELGHPDVEALREKHRGLWRFYVCISRDHETRIAEAGRICQEYFGYENQLAPITTGRLAFGRP